MTPSWVPLAAALLGAAAVVVGNALNPFINSKRAHGLWMRDKRALFFEEFSSGLSEARKVMYDMEFARSGHVRPDLGPYKERSWDSYNKMRTAASALQLYASGPMATKIEQTYESFFNAFSAYGSIGRNQGTPIVRDDRSGVMPDWDQADRVFRTRDDEVVNMMRAELRVVRRRWFGRGSDAEQISNDFRILPRG